MISPDKQIWHCFGCGKGGDIFSFLQEIEGDTWQKLSQRISGINTAGQLKGESFSVKELPYMFSSWREYRDYLLENLITDVFIRKKFKDKMTLMDKIYQGRNNDVMHREHINTILANDYHMTKLTNFERRPANYNWRKKNGRSDRLSKKSAA